ncbi:MAG: DEAD/DEAH box helicase [Gammaproteobacteria bacterium]|nr:DEAD/DEAH box helicase [Gammaproteobacteria bacterium]MYJ51682.1 DEAD/DEAH box helicase [Gammaproteobacteria bacterium]
METIEELVEFLQHALDDRARGRVLDTGEAWSIIRQDGVIPDNASVFRPTLSADLAEYGFALLDAGLELNALDARPLLAKRAFKSSGKAFENLVRNGDPTDPQRGFHRVIAAASYHLGGFTAVAYALFRPVDAEEQNLNTAEICLVRLMLRDLEGVRSTAREWLRDDRHLDAAIVERLQGVGGNLDAEIGLILIGSVCRALSCFEFALRTGESKFVENSREILLEVAKLASESGMSSLWWIIRLMLGLLGDLWSQSLHVVLPNCPPNDASERYSNLRTIFISSLFSRKLAEIELWPSQVDAARRAADPNDDLVVSLPTSAGKTRIAELATLTALAMDKRTMIITPLRALSAQSEQSFRSRFAPLGANVSSLYGRSGLSAGDVDALRSHDIVVSTPEKLDFALRSDPAIIDNVGLIVLDEGHLIGPGDREIRYEILVQRLLRRADAGERRIVCLSAVLPDGEHLNDMTAWIRSDEDGEPVRLNWQPTDQRFGTLEWSGTSGRLNYSLDQNGPFVGGFIRQLPPRGEDRKPYPRELRDVVLMSAWRFAKKGKRALIFITQANWVEGYGKQAVKLVKKGYLPSLLEVPEDIESAMMIGAEWLGRSHPAVQCLRYGMAVHHGKLPSPFLREVERLLASGKIKVTATSPTLAQGLNLNAAVLLVPYLFRRGEPIPSEEFANVSGRAGRAFVDTEGLILHVMEDKFVVRRNQWRRLVKKMHERSLESGLIAVIHKVIQRLAANGIEGAEGYEYLANAREAWRADEDNSGEGLEELVAKVDSIVLGLVEALDADSKDLPKLLDEALSNSLWERQLKRHDPLEKKRQLHLLTARARLIWGETTQAQRHGHYAMGVGLETGIQVDAMAETLAKDLDQADRAALQGNIEELHESLVRLADRLLTIRPFAYDKLDQQNWTEILREWLSGRSLSDIGSTHVELIENVFMYRLVWALEAVRIRRHSLGWQPEDEMIPGAAAACVDTGLPDFRMTLLVRAGLASREAAQMVVDGLNPDFFDGSAMRRWLAGDIVEALSSREDWPSESTTLLWKQFRSEALSIRERAWRKSTEPIAISKLDPTVQNGALVRIEPEPSNGGSRLADPDMRRVGWLEKVVEESSNSVTYGEIDLSKDKVLIHRIGLEV